MLAEVFEVISAQTIEELNKGTRKDLIPTRLAIPERLENHPTLEEKYVSFCQDVSKMVIKLYTGWWDDIPSHWTRQRSMRRLARSLGWQAGLAMLSREREHLCRLILSWHHTSQIGRGMRSQMIQRCSSW